MKNAYSRSFLASRHLGWGAARGASLIEVLVSVVILSIALLGAAGIQAGVAKYKINTWARGAISTLYSDFSDRIRMNSDVAGSNFVTGVNASSQYVLTDNWETQQADALTTPTPNCFSATCSTTERAAFDMVVWRQRVRAELPQGAALVSGDRKDGINLTLMWFDKEHNDKGNSDDTELVTSKICDGTETGMARQNCCPSEAEVPAGVRCAQFSFLP